jgi:opacity protein-like surface antigen
MRHVTRMVLGIAALMVSTVVVASPAAAASAHRPDGWIRAEGQIYGGTNYPHQGPWRGKDIHNTTALNQKATVGWGCDAEPGDYAYYTVNIQNDGSVSDRFKVHGTGGAGHRYFHGTTNITTAVAAGTFKTTSLSPGASYRIQVRLYVIMASKSLVTITSVGDSSRSDAVKAAITICPA